MNLHQRTPDIDHLYAVLRREVPARATLFELFMNLPLYERLAGRSAPSQNQEPAHLEFLVDAFAAAGYDYTTTHACALQFPSAEHDVKSTISLNAGFSITDEATFESYPWPNPESYDYSKLDRIAAYMPGNMKLMVMGPGGVLENVISLVGYDNLCFMLYEEPALAQAVFDRVGSILLRYYQIAAQFDAVGLIMSNDDWGFNTQTFLSPDMMRRYVFPWHRRIVEAGHAQGKPVLLHSCGYFADVMEDVISMGYDGKHSYEDSILPVEDAYERWHSRIAILGGIDMDCMSRHAPAEIAARCRGMLERTATRGGYALGTGNSIPEYIPVENYLAMIQTALQA